MIRHCRILCVFLIIWRCLLIYSFSPNLPRNPTAEVRSSCSVTASPPLSRPFVRYSSSSTLLSAKLWDRLQIEEDPEPRWYLLNCVAGLEMDLLRQCRLVCQDMPDAIKFVVPTVRKTRSHGANRMVTETKVQYQGYVFAKLRLCEEVYEAIQGLDLCRSWMGTVNHKGYKKLPPAPQALNELEVENFGLENIVDIEEEEEEDENDSNVIVDTAEKDDSDDKSKVNEEDLKVYQGFRVEDMVKVTAPGKFFDEDGIVRRLKEGKIFVRFYTYGTLFEEWLDPGDVRKLSDVEVLKGLSGPTQPVTQRDLDGPSTDRYGRYNDDARPSDLRRSLMGSVRGGGPRERRQDRTANRYRQQQDREQDRNDRNWNWYKDQQEQQRRESGGGVSDGEWKMRPGSRQGGDRDDDWALGDVDSQWGRGGDKPRQQQRRRGGDTRPPQRNKRDNRRAQAAIDGQDDWSAFVSPTSSSSPDDSGADDFFQSLMTDLSKDLGDKPSPRSRESKRPAANKQDEDEFFASLMSELSNDQTEKDATPDAPPRERSTTRTSSPKQASSDSEEDFFATLEAELGSAFEDDVPLNARDGDDSDAFFAELEAEISPSVGYDDQTTRWEERSIVAEEESPNLGASPEVSPTPKASSSSKPKSSASVEPSQLDKCTVPVLKDMLRERGLKVSGKKAELIERLSQAS